MNDFLLMFVFCLARRLQNGSEMIFEFSDIAFLVSQLRTLNRQMSKCLMNLPWPCVGNLPSFFYRIFVPTFENFSSIGDSTLYNF